VHDNGAITDTDLTINVDEDNAHVALSVLSRIKNLYVFDSVGIHEYGDVDIALELTIVHDAYDEHNVIIVGQ
jgi:hypothetical protein